MNLFEAEQEESIRFLKRLFHYRKTIFFFVISAVVLSVVITFFIPKKYQSSAIIYPANSHANTDIFRVHQFGYETDTEQLLQLLHSSSIRDSVITKFNLVDYYELDKNEKDWKDQIVKKYIKDFTFTRTKYLAIVITATTKNPEFSADIVNYIVDAVNQFRPAIFRNNLLKEIKFLEDEYALYDEKLRIVTSEIYEEKDSTKTEEIIENFLLRTSKQDYVKDDFINSQKIANLIEEYRFAKQKFIEIKYKLAEANQFMIKPFLDNYIIDKAVPSYKKASPSYLINAIIAFFSSGVISILWLTFAFKIPAIRNEIYE